MDKKNITAEIEKFLEKLRKSYSRVHTNYEKLFWVSYMGDHSVDDKKIEAEKKKDAFCADTKLKQKVEEALEVVKDRKQKQSLQHWKNFFEIYQTPEELLELKSKIAKAENDMRVKVSKRKEGYIDPKTKKFIPASYLKMRGIMRTESDEKLRKACFDATEELALTNVSEYVEYVGLLNEFAQKLGYTDYYDMNLQKVEGMTKSELFKIFDDIYEKTKYAFKDIRKIEKQMPGLRKPWNFGYMMAGDFTKEEDQYFPFDQALERWGRSFTNLGIDMAKGKIQLDLLDRKGKYANGFCHWPVVVSYKDGKLVPGQSNFTCNVVYGQVGSASIGYTTLFHEGGHAAHMLNITEKDTCLNHEYPPMSTAWAETQSMFIDTIFSSYEWRSRYATNSDGEIYPFDLYKRKVEKLSVNRPLSLNGIISVATFEKEIYESKNLTPKKVIELAKKNFKKYFDMEGDSLTLLNIPHIYSLNSCCYYHGYGLAEIALMQWRAYFMKKYGYIVDNPNIGKEMKKVWKYGSAKTFKELIIEATGKKLSASDWLKDSSKTIPQILKDAKQKENKLKAVKSKNKIHLNADIRMVSGKKTISTNSKSFEDMADKYARWLNQK